MLGVHDSELFQVVLLIIDNILFTFYVVAVAYLFIFAIGSIIRKKIVYPEARKNYRYGVLFYVGSDGSMVIVESVNSFLKQKYHDYEILVVSNVKFNSINATLSQMPVTLLVADVPNYNKSSAVKYAVLNTCDDKYDVIVIMDSDSEVESNFLQKVNDAYYSGGMAIQTHRLAKKLDSDTAIFGAVSEEINNSIFRLGHVNLGLSSALIGSGMVLNFEWLKSNIVGVTNNDLEKQLEAMLLQQFVFIEYLNDVVIYGGKAAKIDDFYNERSDWSTSKKQSVKELLRKFIKALSDGNWGYIDKLFQWLIPSRMIIAGTLFIIAITLMILSWNMALKWWVLLLMLILAFSIALPDYLIDKRFIKALRGAPILFVVTVFNLLKRKLSFKK